MSETVPAAAHARLRAVTHELSALRAEGARLVYRMGQLLREVQEAELWRAGGHASFTAWLEQDTEIAKSSAHRAIAVARHFSEEIAARYGLDKLTAGLRYLELTRREERPGDLIAADLRCRDARGRYLTVPFHTATLEQIRDAIALLEQRGATPREPSLDERLSRLERALPAPAAGLRPAKQRVELVRTRGGELSLSFRQIPLSELETFLAAVRRELLEQPGG